MATSNPAKKRQLFSTPTYRILINSEDIKQKYGLTASTITIEQTLDNTKYLILIDDPQATWSESALFEPGQTIELHLGASSQEIIITDSISAIKSVFYSDRTPQVEISGETKSEETLTLKTKALPVLALSYGRDLLSFAGTVTVENPPPKTLAAKKPSTVFRCQGESMGCPNIKPGVTLALTGLGRRFSRNYSVERAIHTIDNVYGYKTKFEAKA